MSVSHSEVNLCDTKNAVPLEPPCCRLRPGIMRSGDSRQVRLLAKLSVRPLVLGSETPAIPARLGWAAEVAPK